MKPDSASTDQCVGHGVGTTNNYWAEHEEADQWLMKSCHHRTLLDGDMDNDMGMHGEMRGNHDACQRHSVQHESGGMVSSHNIDAITYTMTKELSSTLFV